MHDFDLFVIGGGSGGVRAARTAAALGAKVGLAEDRYFGGTCVNVGCIPKKLYALAADYAAAFEDSAGFGWTLPPKPHFDWHTLRDNKSREIHRLQGIYRQLLLKAGVSIHASRARLLDAHTVDIDGKQVSARHILLATGGWPQLPDIPGKELACTSNEIFDLEHFPQRLLIIGAGYIAVEFASIFSGLGSKVWLSLRGEQVLRGFDEDIRQHFGKELSRHVEILPGTNVERIERTDAGCLLASFREGGTLEIDTVLLATGRKANTKGLGLENTRVKLDDEGKVLVDEQFRTDEPSIFALGDVVGRLALTPVALAEGMFVADHLFGSKTRQMDYRNIPTAVFCHPNISTVGLTEQQAREHGEILVFATDFRHLRHTLSGRDERTFMKVIVDKASDKVLGMHMVGSDAGEIIQGFAAAMMAGITKQQLDATIGIHPSAAEEFVTMRVARQ
jgi:glutathione reductase (NADPH)